MTKESLYSAKFFNSVADHEDMIEALDKFFESNVCIPKGENRHPHALELCEWLLDSTKEVEANFKSENYWKDMSKVNALIISDAVKYRIKPSEPVYEWQWYRKVDGKVIDWSEAFRTEQENQDRWSEPKEWYKFEETKRERK